MLNKNKNNDAPMPPPFQFKSEQRKDVVMSLFQEARNLERKMDTAFIAGDMTRSEIHFETLNGIYSRISSKEYKYCVCH